MRSSECSPMRRVVAEERLREGSGRTRLEVFERRQTACTGISMAQERVDEKE